MAKEARRRVSVEEWATRLIADELRVEVEIHDDGSEPSMFDLRVGPASEPLMAIECVGAVDPVRTKTWNSGLAEGAPLHMNVRGDWGVSIRPDARLKSLAPAVEQLVGTLEDAGVDRLDALYRLRPDAPDLARLCAKAGIVRVTRIREKGAGEGHLWMQGIGGAVNHSGKGVGEWVEGFLSADERKDVLVKLRMSRAPDREVFIVVDFGGAPWHVESYLRDGSHELPPVAPNLAAPVTGVWLIGSSKRLHLVNGQWWHVGSKERFRQ